MNYMLHSLATFMASLIFLLVSGCASVHSAEDVSGLNYVNHHIGRVFISKYDLYSYRRDHFDLDIPVIGIPKGLISGYGSPRLPYPANHIYVGHKDGPVTIVGFIPKGTKFVIKKILYDSEPTSNYIHIIFSLDGDSEGLVQYFILSNIKNSRYQDFGLGDMWIISRVADEITQKSQ